MLIRWFLLVAIAIAGFRFDWWGPRAATALAVIGVIGWFVHRNARKRRSARRPGAPLSRTPIPPVRREPSPPPRREPSAPAPYVEPRPTAPSTPPQTTPSEPRPQLKQEPIPRVMWGKNARNVLSEEAWDVVRSIVLEEHDWKCALCGHSNTNNLECHEVWTYPWPRRGSKSVPVMKLVGLQSLCRYCHGAKHIGCSRWKGILPQVKKHLQRVYDITNDELNRLESDAAAEARKVSTRKARELDLTYLNHERFVLVREMMGGRMFGTNELHNCRDTGEDS